MNCLFSRIVHLRQWWEALLSLISCQASFYFGSQCLQCLWILYSFSTNVPYQNAISSQKGGHKAFTLFTYLRSVEGVEEAAECLRACLGITGTRIQISALTRVGHPTRAYNPNFKGGGESRMASPLPYYPAKKSEPQVLKRPFSKNQVHDKRGHLMPSSGLCAHRYAHLLSRQATPTLIHTCKK